MVCAPAGAGWIAAAGPVRLRDDLSARGFDPDELHIAEVACRARCSETLQHLLRQTVEPWSVTRTLGTRHDHISTRNDHHYLPCTALSDGCCATARRTVVLNAAVSGRLISSRQSSNGQTCLRSMKSSPRERPEYPSCFARMRTRVRPISVEHRLRRGRQVRRFPRCLEARVCLVRRRGGPATGEA
jgi:hypothetical protein